MRKFSSFEFSRFIKFICRKIFILSNHNARKYGIIITQSIAVKFLF